jgi:hypothetical protein
VSSCFAEDQTLKWRELNRHTQHTGRHDDINSDIRLITAGSPAIYKDGSPNDNYQTSDRYLHLAVFAR